MQLYYEYTTTVLFDPYIRLYQVLPPWVRVDLEVMAMKGYSVFPKAPALLEPHYLIVECHIQATRFGEGGLIHLQRCSQCILQSQLSGLGFTWVR